MRQSRCSGKYLRVWRAQGADADVADARRAARQAADAAGRVRCLPGSSSIWRFSRTECATVGAGERLWQRPPARWSLDVAMGGGRAVAPRVIDEDHRVRAPHRGWLRLPTGAASPVTGSRWSRPVARKTGAMATPVSPPRTPVRRGDLYETRVRPWTSWFVFGPAAGIGSRRVGG